MGDISRIEESLREAARGSIKFQPESRQNFLTRALVEKLDARKELVGSRKEGYLFIESGKFLDAFKQDATEDGRVPPEKVVFLRCDDGDRLQKINLSYYAALLQLANEEPGNFFIEDPTKLNRRMSRFGSSTNNTIREPSFGDSNYHSGLSIYVYGDLSREQEINRQMVEIIKETNTNLDHIGEPPLPKFPGFLSENRSLMLEPKE